MGKEICSHHRWSSLVRKYVQRDSAWVELYKEIIWEGRVEEALEMLLVEAKTAKNQTPIMELYNYFKHRIHMMQYGAFRKQGFYIGSGSIESTNKYVILNRMRKSSAMKWSIDGGNAVGHLRAKYQSGEWNEIWNEQAA